jgi:hypothetical protein
MGSIVCTVVVFWMSLSRTLARVLGWEATAGRPLFGHPRLLQPGVDEVHQSRDTLAGAVIERTLPQRRREIGTSSNFADFRRLV